jgi:O-antigen/teichoic acid export membrane protein
MVQIRRFGVVRTSNLVAVWTLLIGMLFFIPFALIVGIAGTLTVTDRFGNTASTRALTAIAIGLFVVLFYAAFLWVFTALGLLLYNLAARWTGGVEIELRHPGERQASP